MNVASNDQCDRQGNGLSKSFEGVPFDPSADVWCLRDAAVEFEFAWDRLKTNLTLEFWEAAKTTTRWYVENRSLSRARNLYIGLLNLISTLGITKKAPLGLLTESHLVQCRKLLGKRREHRLGSLRSFFIRWHEQGHPGIDEGAVRWLSEAKLKGNAKGEAVATQDPVSGPFSQVEAVAIHQSTTAALDAGEITLDDFCLAQLQAALGSRSVQFAALKCIDLVPPKDPANDDWILMVPRAKQHFQRARSELRPRTLIPELAQIVVNQIQDVQSTYRESGQSGIHPDQLPVFPNWNELNYDGFAFHSTGSELGERLDKVSKLINVMSERTGSRLRITSRRFRYTVGTRAAEEGKGELVIAELLDHSDIQQVAVYVRATQKIAENISKAVAFQLAPLAQAFMGTLVRSDADTTQDAGSANLIREPRTFDTLGKCGQLGFCTEAAPIACYTCRRFRAWDDAPHELLLDQLLIDREQVVKTTKDLRIASVNDRTILAIANVVQLCHQRRAPRLP